jgi:geranylgeranyl pyrophosphate synthase
MMNFHKYHQKASRQVDSHLRNVLLQYKKQIRLRVPQVISPYELFTLGVSGGKGLRGTLTRIGYELAAQKANSEISKIAAAFEILHTSLLIHDDVIDQSILRRGKPTLHEALGGDQYGKSQAICLGDFGFFLAVQIIAQSKFDEVAKNKAIAFFSDTILKTVLGQMLDVELSRRDARKKEKDVLTIHQLKTAYYTFVGPLSVGAIIGGATPSLLKKIELFGENLGIAFQIQDDLLGVFGDQKIVGKSVTSDIEEGKNTLLIVYAYEHGLPDQKAVLDTYYGKGKISEKQHLLLKKVFEETGARRYSEQSFDQYIQKALKILPKLTEDEHLKQILHEFITFLVERKS